MKRPSTLSFCAAVVFAGAFLFLVSYAFWGLLAACLFSLAGMLLVGIARFRAIRFSDMCAAAIRARYGGEAVLYASSASYLTDKGTFPGVLAVTPARICFLGGRKTSITSMMDVPLAHIRECTFNMYFYAAEQSGEIQQFRVKQHERLTQTLLELGVTVC